MTQSIQGVIDNLFTVCQTVYASSVDTNNVPVAVYLGPPGAAQPNVLISVASDVRQALSMPTAGTNRSRERAAEVDIMFSIFVPGDEVGQQPANDSCSNLIDQLETYLRTGNQITLGGSCRLAWISEIRGPSPSIAIDEATGAVLGRLADAVVTVTALIRY